MINKCPHCGFEPLDGKLVCPRCGHEIQENIAQKLQDIGEKNRKTNDSVAWSDFEEVSLGALMSQMSQSKDESEEKDEDKNEENLVEAESAFFSEEDAEKQSEKETKEDLFAENPILAAYIRQHREGDAGEGPTLEELVAASREKTTKSDESVEKTIEEDLTDHLVDETSTEAEIERAEEGREIVEAVNNDQQPSETVVAPDDFVEVSEEEATELVEKPSESTSDIVEDSPTESADKTTADSEALIVDGVVLGAADTTISEATAETTAVSSEDTEFPGEEDESSLTVCEDQLNSSEESMQKESVEAEKPTPDDETGEHDSAVAEINEDQADSEARLADEEKPVSGDELSNLDLVATVDETKPETEPGESVSIEEHEPEIVSESENQIEEKSDSEPEKAVETPTDSEVGEQTEAVSTTDPVKEQESTITTQVDDQTLTLESETTQVLDVNIADEDETRAATANLDSTILESAEDSISTSATTTVEANKSNDPVLDPVTYAEDTTEKLAVEPATEGQNDTEELFEPEETETRKPHKKWPILVAAATIALIGGGGYGIYQNQQQEAQAKIVAAKKEKAQAEAIETALAALYQDDDREFLKTGITAADLSAITNQLDQFDGKKADLQQELTTLEDKYQLQSQVNDLFSEAVIAGDKMKENIAIKSDAKLAVSVPKEDTAFNRLMAMAVANYNQQYEALTAAQAAVSPLLKDGKSIDKPVQSDLTQAQKLVAALVDSPDKENLETQLSLVQTKVAENQAAAKKAKEQAAAEAAKKAAEEKAAAEKAATEKAAAEAAEKAKAEQNATNDNQENTLPADASSNMTPNMDNRPILDSVQGDIADSSNPAWTWAAGVKADVLATCIERGYIVEGGYRLEPVRIENGEGYYNLYATNNQASLTKGMTENELPLYLVTINCKTGYFRGNGNDHTVR